MVKNKLEKTFLKHNSSEHLQAERDNKATEQRVFQKPVCREGIPSKNAKKLYSRRKQEPRAGVRFLEQAQSAESKPFAETNADYTPKMTGKVQISSFSQLDRY